MKKVSKRIDKKPIDLTKYTGAIDHVLMNLDTDVFDSAEKYVETIPGEPIKIKFVQPTGKLALEFAKKMTELRLSDGREEERLANYQIKMAKFALENQGLSEIDLYTKALEKNYITVEEVEALLPKTIRTEEMLDATTSDLVTYIELFKSIIDMKLLTDDEKIAVESNWDSDFWLSQDIKAVKNSVKNFRKYHL